MTTMTIEKTDLNDPFTHLKMNNIMVSDTTTDDLHILTGAEHDHIQVNQVTGNLLVESCSGNDRIEISNVTGNLEVHAGPGNDNVIIHTHIGGCSAIYGDDGDDLLLGGPSRDHLYGGHGDDTLIGGGGPDVLEGGDNTGHFRMTPQGVHLVEGDHLWGGYGAYDGENNTFVFRPGNGVQTIHDYQINLDTIEIHGYNPLDAQYIHQGSDTFIRLSETAGILVLNNSIHSVDLDWVTPVLHAQSLLPPPVLELEDASHQSIYIKGKFIAFERDSGDPLVDNNLKVTIVGNPIVRIDNYSLCPCENSETADLIAALTGPSALSFTELTSYPKKMKVSYEYNVEDINLDFLPEGHELTVSYQLVVTDYMAHSPIQELTFTIIGTNDPATITGTNTGEVKEDNALNAITQVSGKLFISDLDEGENFFQLPTQLFDSQNEWTYTLKTVSSFGADFMNFDNNTNAFKENTMPNIISRADLLASTDVIGSYGTFNFDTTGAWTYTLDNSVGSATDQLQEGEVAHDTLTVVSFDGSASTVIDITVIGTNDLPVIGGDVTGSIFEGDGVSANVISGQMTIADPDHDESSFVVEGNLIGNYGIFTCDSTGAWTYTVNDSAGSAVDQLADGQVLNDLLQVNSFDGSSPMAIEITITGTNDLPVIGGVSTGAVKEDNAPDAVTTASGALTIADPDAGENSFIVPENLDGTYGSFAFNTDGSWVYTLNNAVGSATDALVEGEEVHDFLTVMSFDNTTATTIDITVTGTNDVPVITGDNSGVVTEDNVPGAITTVFGTLVVNDPDAGESSFQLPGEPLMFADVLPAEGTFNSSTHDHFAHADLSTPFAAFGLALTQNDIVL